MCRTGCVLPEGPWGADVGVVRLQVSRVEVVFAILPGAVSDWLAGRGSGRVCRAVAERVHGSVTEGRRGLADGRLHVDVAWRGVGRAALYGVRVVVSEEEAGGMGGWTLHRDIAQVTLGSALVWAGAPEDPAGWRG